MRRFTQNDANAKNAIALGVKVHAIVPRSPSWIEGRQFGEFLRAFWIANKRQAHPDRNHVRMRSDLLFARVL